MSNGLVKGSGSHDYARILLCLVYELHPLFNCLMYANIGKLICYRRRLSTIQGD